MEYHVIPDILGAIILAATFVFCLRSFRREDPLRVRSLREEDEAQGPHPAGAEQKSLAELLHLMNESVDCVNDRRAAPPAAGPVRTPVPNPLDGIEVTVRVNAQRAPGTPFVPADIINAVWEHVDPVTRTDLTFGRNFPTLNSEILTRKGLLDRPR